MTQSHDESKPSSATSAQPKRELAVDTKTSGNDLVFKQNGQKAIIKRSTIEQFFAENEPIESQRKKEVAAKSPDWANQLLAQYGIKSANDVITFLKSPTGETVKKLINDQIVLLAKLQEMQDQNNQEKELQKQRFIAFMLLAAIYKEKVAEQQFIRDLEEQIENNLAAHETKTPATLLPAGDIVKEMAQILSAYTMAARIITDDLEKKLLEAKELEDEMAELAAEGELIEQRYNILDTYLQFLNTYHDELAGAATQNKITNIEMKIAEINGQINQKREQIDALIETGQDKEAAGLLHELYGLHVQEAGIREMLSVFKQEKSFYDVEGRKTFSYKDAEYILSNQQKIVKHEGKYYLLNEGQDFDSMSPEEKSKSQQRYEHAKPEISSIKREVVNNKTKEKTMHTEKMDSSIKRSDRMQEDILKLTNQINQVQAAQANFVNFMQGLNITADDTQNKAQTHSRMPATPRPTPTMQTSSIKKAKPTTAVNYSLAQSYRHVLELMKHKPTQDSINRLKDGFVLPNGQPNLNAQNKITNTIKPGAPIHPATLINLLKYLVAVSGSTYRASAPQITKQQQQQQQQQKPTAPTPFQTKPSMDPHKG
jgi:effector protein LidA